jgi:hypothetical protein
MMSGTLSVGVREAQRGQTMAMCWEPVKVLMLDEMKAFLKESLKGIGWD